MMKHSALRRASLYGTAAAACFALCTSGCADGGAKAYAVPQDNGALMLVAGTFDRSCEEALSIVFQCGRWELFVHVDPEDQTPGAKPMDSPKSWALGYFSDGSRDGDECSIYGDTFEIGTFEVTDTSDGRVKFRFDGTANDDFNADGEYDAPLCD